MRLGGQKKAAILLALVAASSRPTSPETPAAVAAATAGPGGIAGGWVGWATLTNESPGLACRYESAPGESTVRLELTGDAGLRGSAAIDIPAAPGSGCPPLRKRYTVAEVTQGPGTVAFTDSGGNEWTLAVRNRGALLQGMLAFRDGGPEQPLAEGFTVAGGVSPVARLSGEVQLGRSGEPADAPVAAVAGDKGGARPPAPRKTSVGTHLKHLGIVLGANVVGAAAIYGVNKLGKGSSETGTVTCSQRFCFVGAPGQQCFCDPDVVSDGSCGLTEAGLDVGSDQPCDRNDYPCRTGLSCNDGVCEERFQRCPW